MPDYSQSGYGGLSRNGLANKLTKQPRQPYGPGYNFGQAGTDARSMMMQIMGRGGVGQQGGTTYPAQMPRIGGASGNSGTTYPAEMPRIGDQSRQRPPWQQMPYPGAHTQPLGPHTMEFRYGRDDIGDQGPRTMEFRYGRDDQGPSGMTPLGQAFASVPDNDNDLYARGHRPSPADQQPGAFGGQATEDFAKRAANAAARALDAPGSLVNELMTSGRPVNTRENDNDLYARNRRAPMQPGQANAPAQQYPMGPAPQLPGVGDGQAMPSVPSPPLPHPPWAPTTSTGYRNPYAGLSAGGTPPPAPQGPAGGDQYLTETARQMAGIRQKLQALPPDPRRLTVAQVEDKWAAKNQQTQEQQKQDIAARNLAAIKARNPHSEYRSPGVQAALSGGYAPSSNADAAAMLQGRPTASGVPITTPLPPPGPPAVVKIGGGHGLSGYGRPGGMPYPRENVGMQAREQSMYENRMQSYQARHNDRIATEDAKKGNNAHAGQIDMGLDRLDSMNANRLTPPQPWIAAQQARGAAGPPPISSALTKPNGATPAPPPPMPPPAIGSALTTPSTRTPAPVITPNMSPRARAKAIRNAQDQDAINKTEMDKDTLDANREALEQKRRANEQGRIQFEKDKVDPTKAPGGIGSGMEKVPATASQEERHAAVKVLIDRAMSDPALANNPAEVLRQMKEMNLSNDDLESYAANNRVSWADDVNDWVNNSWLGRAMGADKSYNAGKVGGGRNSIEHERNAIVRRNAFIRDKLLGKQ